MSEEQRLQQENEHLREEMKQLREQLKDARVDVDNERDRVQYYKGLADGGIKEARDDKHHYRTCRDTARDAQAPLKHAAQFLVSVAQHEGVAQGSMLAVAIDCLANEASKLSD